MDRCGGRPGMHVIHAWPDNAMKVVAKYQLKENRWQHVCVTYDGKASANSKLKSMDGKKQEKAHSHTKLKKHYPDGQTFSDWKKIQIRTA